jgi:hypothetical protein
MDKAAVGYESGQRRMKPHELTVGITDEALGPRQNVIPFDGEYHDVGTCAFCGFRGCYPALIRTVLLNAPDRISRRCVDSVACIRRRRAAA